MISLGLIGAAILTVLTLWLQLGRTQLRPRLDEAQTLGFSGMIVGYLCFQLLALLFLLVGGFHLINHEQSFTLFLFIALCYLLNAVWALFWQFSQSWHMPHMDGGKRYIWLIQFASAGMVISAVVL
ncbi:hypothetical protein NFHSH190041_22040 [Shewanella sp. NFH-SH190041]|uniref:hypothetical protein n=1 Tax=Shewanella sp. NFH-SH190041 TaxID=2950245 RepID=UPI0021C2F172|nr:hypothetical protein [Shewanella sp. NFH-SH190041]BDM64752.1 hypothetical protein NFHSH190041_22040 [Shewanella sp. NFH-SH190041]